MIKFRAWHIHKQIMCEVIRIDFKLGIVTLDLEPDDDEYYWTETDWNISQVILMQYTGLKDKNGVEIYQGDVLYHPLQGKRKVYYPYSDSVASYGLREINTGFGSTLQDAHAVWKVIGNIYENPELLEVVE